MTCETAMRAGAFLPPARLVTRQPPAILVVGFVPLAVPHLLRIGQTDFQAPFQHVEHRLPVGTGRLHHHVGDALRFQPVPQRLQLRRDRSESPPLDPRLSVQGPGQNADRQKLFPHVDSGAPLDRCTDHLPFSFQTEEQPTSSGTIFFLGSTAPFGDSTCRLGQFRFRLNYPLAIPAAFFRLRPPSHTISWPGVNGNPLMRGSFFRNRKSTPTPSARHTSTPRAHSIVRVPTRPEPCRPETNAPETSQRPYVRFARRYCFGQ